MLERTTLKVSGERLKATYEFSGAAGDARARVEALCVEQTIEFPADLVPDDDIKQHIIGDIESYDEVDAELVRATVSFAVETTGYEFPQLLNVLFGNSSLLRGVKLVDVDLPSSLTDRFTGPRFGIEGLRTLFEAPGRPLLATALKPMGSSPYTLARMAYELAAGGIDMIKDDHSLANQPFATYRSRVEACAEAVRQANFETGGASIYMPSVNAPYRMLEDRVQVALEAGAGGLLVLPGITGFDHMLDLASRSDVGIPLMGHPALLGGFVSSPDGGMAHGLLFGKLMRYAGADLSIFPNFGGRFSFSQDECMSIATACTTPMAGVNTIFPAPGGGMTMGRIDEMVDYYGKDVALLIGGDLHRGRDLRSSAEAFRAAVS